MIENSIDFNNVQNSKCVCPRLEENTQRRRADMACDHAASAKSLMDQTLTLQGKLEKLQQGNKETVESFEKQANRRCIDVAAAISSYIRFRFQILIFTRTVEFQQNDFSIL